MGTPTPFLSLLKPDPPERVNVNTHVNQNFDKIDAGILAQKNRIDVLQGGWTNYTPVIRHDVTDIAYDITLARWRKVSDIVEVWVEGTTTGNAEAIAKAPMIKVPYLVTNHIVTGQGMWHINISGGPGINFRPMQFIARLDTTSNKSFVHSIWMTENLTTVASDVSSTGDSPASTKARMTASFRYITDGTPVT